jgi:hypothetical protein
MILCFVPMAVTIFHVVVVNVELCTESQNGRWMRCKRLYATKIQRLCGPSLLHVSLMSKLPPLSILPPTYTAHAHPSFFALVDDDDEGEGPPNTNIFFS